MNDDAIERVAVALEGDPFVDGVHAWKVTISLAWLVVAHCTACGALGSASENGLQFIERTPSRMIYRECAPSACLRVAASVRKEVPRAAQPAAAQGVVSPNVAAREGAATAPPAGMPGSHAVQLSLLGAA
jgi:hypothetical protein